MPLSKSRAVESLGADSLLMPAWIKAALAANDRIKLLLSLLQAARSHAQDPASPCPDWGHELAQAGMQDLVWPRALVSKAYLDGDRLMVPGSEELLQTLAQDLRTMARPLGDAPTPADREGGSAIPQRSADWVQRLKRLEAVAAQGLDVRAIAELTHGDRAAGDSLHLLVMDLHKAINRRSAELATEDIDGAHVWQIRATDREWVESFMAGLNGTAPLKFDHPGLDTAVTRDGEQLLIQNDIGTNDAHVVVIAVRQREITVTYSDLHPPRHAFFRHRLALAGFGWQVDEPVRTPGLNEGRPYVVGVARLQAVSKAQLRSALRHVGGQLVFLVDWNRARKRLQWFVRKSVAVEILGRAADRGCGHMAWLLAGGEKVVHSAMQAVDPDLFRIGERLDDLIGEAPAADFLVDLLDVSARTLLEGRPREMVTDQARMMLARTLRERAFEFDLLADHAAYTHALASALCDALDRLGQGADPSETTAAVDRAKGWEHRADELLTNVRQRALRHSRWRPLAQLLEHSDDVADAIEEAVFLVDLTCREPAVSVPAAVRSQLAELGQATFAAVQDLVRVVEIGRHVSEFSDQRDSEAFLQALWRMLRAERQCDELARQTRRTALALCHDRPSTLMLVTEIGTTIEKATDALLAAGYALRQLVVDKSELSP